MGFKKALRTAQTYAAPLLGVKAWGQRKLREVGHMPSDPCYRAFEHLPLRHGRQFLDVGGNRGQTVASFRLYDKTAPIFSFEPNPVFAQWLASEYADDPEVTIKPFGLGSENGHFDLYVPYYRGFMFDGLASFDWDSAHDWLNSDRIYGFNDRHLKIEKVRCEVRVWDEVETRPDLVKIDVQGFETAVLRGGLQTIRYYRPIFLLENGPGNPHEEVLFAEDYRRAAYKGRRMKIDQLGDKNTFYIPEERANNVVAALE